MVSFPLSALIGSALLQAALHAPPRDTAAAFPDTHLTPVPYSHVTLNGVFWEPRLRALREGTLEANFHQCEITGRFANFDKAAGAAEGEYQGLLFNDSDVYKLVEGASYLLSTETDPQRKAALDHRLDGLIARIAAAQREDGYINTWCTLKEGLDKRWTNEEWNHESYCIGHLIEAGIAHHHATGKSSLLDVAIKAADHVSSVFGPGRLADPPGHQEIELALIKLALVANQDSYTQLARFLIEQRGRARPAADGTPKPLYGEYSQDHLPIRRQFEAAGHAVRACYFYAAATDLAMLERDDELMAVLDSLWRDITTRRIYLTGGIGPSAHNEGFTTPYDLPNHSAYQETCASIALAMWAARMNLLHADARFMDTFENALFNAILAGVSLDGREFFYVNPLASRGRHHRRDWYQCACCPPNILRFLASLGGYAYAVRDGTVFVNLYAAGSAEIPLGDGAATIIQTTDYPWDGDVRLRIETKGLKELKLALREPAWCDTFTLRLNGIEVAPPAEHGYRTLAISGQATVEISMPMEPRRIYSDPRIQANRGRAAIRRGPVVYALEAADHKDSLAGVMLPIGAALRAAPATWENPECRYIRIEATGSRAAPIPPDGPLYTPAKPAAEQPIVAIPYFMWDNRAAGDMAVWIPETIAALDPAPVPGVAATASHCHPADTPLALHDGIEPSSSSDRSIPRLTFWPHKGTQEWVRYDFDTPRRISLVNVYWFADAPAGGCALPESWSLEYLEDDAWKPAETRMNYPTEPNTFNTVRFDPITTSALRLRVQLREGASAGILEWRFGD